MKPQHDAPEHGQERARDIYERQAKERQQAKRLGGKFATK